MATSSSSEVPTPTVTKIPLTSKLAVGAFAGIIGTSAIFPIDVVKTRLQNQNPDRLGRLRYNGALHCFRSIIKREGFGGLYRGLGANLIGVTPEKAIKLAANDVLRDYFTESNKGGPIKLWQEVAAGCGAGTIQFVATNPMEIVKIRLQLQGTDPTVAKMSPAEVVRRLGIRGLYKGSAATLMRDVPFSAIFFPLYSNLNKWFGGENPGVGSTLAAGCISGALSSGLCTPADVIKTRLQVKGGTKKYGGIVGCYRTIVEQEGYAALYKGVGPRMAVVAPLFGISLLAFEVQKSYMLKRAKAKNTDEWQAALEEEQQQQQGDK